jgi:hypothetical protein
VRKHAKSKNIVIVIAALLTLLAGLAAYIITKYFEETAKDEDYSDEEFVDENGVVYTDERNFV